MKQLVEFIQRKIIIKQVGPTKFSIFFPMYKVDGGLYEIYLVAKDGKYFLSDEGSTYFELNYIFELEESEVEKHIQKILNQYGCRKHESSNAFITEVTPQDIHQKLSSLIQAISFMLNMKIFFN